MKSTHSALLGAGGSIGRHREKSWVQAHRVKLTQGGSSGMVTRLGNRLLSEASSLRRAWQGARRGVPQFEGAVTASMVTAAEARRVEWRRMLACRIGRMW